MTKYRAALPQLEGDFYLTDGGLETTLIFQEGQELPHFAAFHLHSNPDLEASLRKYFRTYCELAQRFDAGLILESATWRASADWGDRLGYSPAQLAAVNRRAVALLEEMRDAAVANRPMVLSGCLGPRGDGYVPQQVMTESEAEKYHQPQVDVFATTAADLVTAMTMNYVEEAIGIVRAAQKASLPVVISFTVETDGKLPTGQSLLEAIRQVDAATAGYPAYFMINCAHPSHFTHVLTAPAPEIERIRGLRANASRLSHTELNEAPNLDAGDPVALGSEYAALKSQFLQQVNVMGGCCGTDDRHVEQIAAACRPMFPRRREAEG